MVDPSIRMCVEAPPEERQQVRQGPRFGPVVMRPESLELSITLHTVKVFEAAFVMRIALNVVEDVSGRRFGQQVEALARLGRAQFVSWLPRLAGMLKPGLRDELCLRGLGHAANGVIEAGQRLHSRDPRGIELLRLPAADARHVEEAVLGDPNAGAVVGPAAQRTIDARDGPRGQRLSHEGLEPRPCPARIVGVVGEPQRRTVTGPELDMGEFGRHTLHLGEKVGLEHELKDVFRMRPALQLGVGDLITEGPERRRALHALQEVRPAAPVARQERTLKGDLGASGQRRPRSFGVARQIVPGDLDDILAGSLQPLKMHGLMGIALLLQERNILAVLAGFGAIAVQEQQIERRRMSTPHEPHQVGCRKHDLAVDISHAHFQRTCGNPQGDRLDS